MWKTEGIIDKETVKKVPTEELIKLYCRDRVNELSDHPFGAEARRKAEGDELISRGIAEIHLPALVDPIKVLGSESASNDIEYHLVTPGKHW